MPAAASPPPSEGLQTKDFDQISPPLIEESQKEDKIISEPGIKTAPEILNEESADTKTEVDSKTNENLVQEVLSSKSEVSAPCSQEIMGKCCANAYFH